MAAVCCKGITDEGLGQREESNRGGERETGQIFSAMQVFLEEQTKDHVGHFCCNVFCSSMLQLLCTKAKLKAKERERIPRHFLSDYPSDLTPNLQNDVCTLQASLWPAAAAAAGACCCCSSSCCCIRRAWQRKEK